MPFTAHALISILCPNSSCSITKTNDVVDVEVVSLSILNLLFLTIEIDISTILYIYILCRNSLAVRPNSYIAVSCNAVEEVSAPIRIFQIRVSIRSIRKAVCIVICPCTINGQRFD